MHKKSLLRLVLVVVFVVVLVPSVSAQNKSSQTKESLSLNNKMFRAAVFVPYLKLGYVKSMVKDEQFSKWGDGLNLGFTGSFDASHAKPNYNFELYAQYLSLKDNAEGIESITSFHWSNNLDFKLAGKQKRTYLILRLGFDLGSTAAVNNAWSDGLSKVYIGSVGGLGVHVFPRSTVNKGYTNSSRLEYKLLVLHNWFTNTIVSEKVVSNMFTLQLQIKNVFKDRY